MTPMHPLTKYARLWIALAPNLLLVALAWFWPHDGEDRGPALLSIAGHQHFILLHFPVAILMLVPFFRSEPTHPPTQPARCRQHLGHLRLRPAGSPLQWRRVRRARSTPLARHCRLLRCRWCLAPYPPKLARPGHGPDFRCGRHDHRRPHRRSQGPRRPIQT